MNQHNAVPVLDKDDRPIWGAEAIALAINRTLRQTYHLLESGNLAATKIGKVWTSTPRRLRQHFNGEAA